jgi:acyl-CoA synthetase (NDP forming)
MSPERGPHALRALFEPRSIAVVGASRTSGKLSGLPLQLLRRHGWEGRLHAVNPNYDEIDGVPCWPSLTAIDEPVDLAMLMLPPEPSLRAVEEAAALGVPAVVVSAAGFAEVGGVGEQRQLRLQEAVAGGRTRVLGPNCMGVVNLRQRMTATFSGALAEAPALVGNLAFVGQSGAIAGCAMDMARARGIGLSHWVSTGNEADIDVAECAAYLVADPDVSVLCLYVEQLRNPALYLQVAQDAAELGKALIVLKGGRSASGARAAVSHTGALVGDDRVFRAVSEQYGVRLVSDLEEMLAVGAACLRRPARGARLGVVSTSGAGGVILADLAAENGLELPEFSAATAERLAAIAPAHSALSNPVDVTAAIVPHLSEGRSTWRDTCAVIAEDDAVDVVACVVTMVTGRPAELLVDQITEAAATIDKPLLVCWYGGAQCAGSIEELRRRGVPTYTSAALTARAAAAVRAAVPRPRARTLPVPDGSLPDVPPGSVLTEWDCQALLASAGVPVLAGELVTDPAAAEAAAGRLGAPLVVLKVQSADIPHKAAVGALELAVHERDAAATFERLVERVRRDVPDARVEGVLVQPMLTPRLELLTGIVSDRDFGPVLVLGLGGRLAELHEPLAMCVLPLAAGDAAAMAASLEPALRLAHIDPGPARDAVEVLLERLAGLVMAAGLSELELNPVAVGQDGELAVLDALAATAPAPQPVA